ncbi:MAG TPA: hypothetical protein VJB16_05115, partial [archaeon]|nr:hypothetical protein [archaeon]
MVQNAVNGSVRLAEAYLFSDALGPAVAALYGDGRRRVYAAIHDPDVLTELAAQHGLAVPELEQLRDEKAARRAKRVPLDVKLAVLDYAYRLGLTKEHAGAIARAHRVCVKSVYRWTADPELLATYAERRGLQPAEVREQRDRTLDLRRSRRHPRPLKVEACIAMACGEDRDVIARWLGCSLMSVSYWRRDESLYPDAATALGVSIEAFKELLDQRGVVDGSDGTARSKHVHAELKFQWVVRGGRLDYDAL